MLHASESGESVLTCCIHATGIVKYSNASPCCYAVALMWLERQKTLKGGTEEPLMTSATYQKILLTGAECTPASHSVSGFMRFCSNNCMPCYGQSSFYRRYENQQRALEADLHAIFPAIMCAAKFLDDLYYSNKHWAQIGGITTAELNQNEVDFLRKMDFR